MNEEQEKAVRDYESALIPEPPTDDERVLEAHIGAIEEAFGHHSSVPWPSLNLIFKYARAGFRRQEPITEATEWEYGERSPHPPSHVWGPWTAEQAAAVNIPEGRAVRRRKAGPWEPVEAARKDSNG